MNALSHLKNSESTISEHSESLSEKIYRKTSPWTIPGFILIAIFVRHSNLSGTSYYYQHHPVAWTAHQAEVQKEQEFKAAKEAAEGIMTAAHH